MRFFLNQFRVKKCSMADAAWFSSHVYLSGKSLCSRFTAMREQYQSHRLKTKTPLYIRTYQKRQQADYIVIAIRGTVGMEDCWYDGLPHALTIDGMTEYQHDAYQALISYLKQQDLPVVLTGHSMGGKIAELLLAQLYVDYVKSPVDEKAARLAMLEQVSIVYAFDSPGTYPLLCQYFKSEFPKQDEDALSAFLQYRQERVIDIVGQPNSANMFHRHAGVVYYLPHYQGVDKKPLHALLLDDYTQNLQERHSIDGLAHALTQGARLHPVRLWGGVSAIETNSSLKRLNNFACSYHEHIARIAKVDPSIRNTTASYMTKLMLSGIKPCQINADDPLVQAAKEHDLALTDRLKPWLDWFKSKLFI